MTGSSSPAAAIKIWAAERFQRLERHVAADPAEGYGLHPARYLGKSLLPAIEVEAGIPVVENLDLCFDRASADVRVAAGDCADGAAHKGMDEADPAALVERLAGRSASHFCSLFDYPQWRDHGA